MKNMFFKLRYYLLYIIFLFWTLIYIIIYKLTGLNRGVDWFCHFMAFKNNGLKIETIGKASDEAKMYIVNHQSFFDISIIEILSRKKHLIWLAKKELTNNIIIRSVMKAHQAIIVDRDDKSQLISIVKKIKKNILPYDDKIFVIFPEGTRNRYHNKLGKFKLGAESIANMLNIKVQPIVISYIKETIDVDSKKLNAKKSIRVSYLDPISASKDNPGWLETCRENMQNEFIKISKNL